VEAFLTEGIMIRQHRSLVQVVLLGIVFSSPGLSFAYELIVDYTAGGVKTSGVGGTGLWEINEDRITDPPLGFEVVLGSIRASYIRQGSFTGATSTRLQLYNHAMSIEYDCYSQTLTGDEWGANSSDEFATSTEGTVAVFSGSECTLDPGISYGVADDNFFTATGQLVFRDGQNFPNAWGAAYEGVFSVFAATQLYFSGSPGNYYLSEQTRDLLKSVGAVMVGSPTATVYRVSFDMGNTDNAYPPLRSKGCTFCDENGNPVDRPTTLGDPVMYNELDGYILPHGTEQWTNIENFVNDPCTGSGGLQVAAGKYYISLFGKWESGPTNHYEWLPYYMVYEVDGNCDTTTPPPPAAVADLALSITDTPDPVTAGKNLTYKYIVTNNGPDTATIVTLISSLPTNVSIVSLPSSCSGTGPITCDLGSIASGTTVSADVVVTPTSVGTIDITARVAATEDDPNLEALTKPSARDLDI
jgi:uncharacterized repeat protein (TIGR01451 family)